MQSLHGVRFLPIARIDDTLLGLDARWLHARGWGVMLLLVVAAAMTAAGPLWARLLMGLSVIAAVILTSLGHELGHVVASRLAGLPVRAVVLAPQGGVTIRVGSDAPVVNVLTALAGPLANAMLGAACISILLAVGPESPSSQFLMELAALQMLTALANLVPWGPMDGRRILAAWRAL